MVSPLGLLSTTSNLIIHATLCLTLTVLLSFLKIPVLFLYGLQTYIHPDDVNPQNNSSHGIKAAIRRPSDTSELKPRKKSKDRFDFDESKAQIFRIKLNDSHLQTRIFFKEFSSAFNSTLVAISSIFVHRFLNVDKDSGILGNGTLVPVLLGLVSLFRVVILLVRIALERSASKRSEKHLSLLLGVLGFGMGLFVVSGIVPKWLLDDFEFRSSLDGLGNFCVAVFMGCIVGFLYMPALRNARAFWLGTDQIRCNLSIISCGWFGRVLLYANYLLVVFTSLLWVSPFAELLVNKNVSGGKKSQWIGKSGNVNELIGYVGMSLLDFNKLRLWCLLFSGVLQFATLRPNVQMFLNEAVLSWYQRLHASRVPDLDYSRAKVFLHNHYLCVVVLQFLAPAALVLLFLGLSQIEDNLFINYNSICGILPCSTLVKDLALFMAWWVVFIWAGSTSIILALYRRGILYVS